MGFESILGIIASLVIPSVGGLAWINERGNRRIDKMLEKNDQHIESILNHMQKVEQTLADMRSEIPLRYTLREDHIRLSERVNRLEMACQRHFPDDHSSNG